MLQILVSFLITAFGIPSLSPILSACAGAFGYALFWHGIRPFRARAFSLGFVWFAGVQAVQLNWMISFDYMGLGILAVYLLVILGLGAQFGLLTRCVGWPMTWRQILGLSGGWVLFEWIRGFFLTGFLWNPVGLTLAASPYAIQMASLVGIYGLCFWVMFVNLLALRQIRLAILCAVLPYAYGVIHQQVLTHCLPSGKEMSVALVQTALRPEQRDYYPVDPEARISPILQWDRLLGYLATAHRAQYDLIALPEGALPHGPWTRLYPYSEVKALWLRHFGKEALVEFPPYSDELLMDNAFLMQRLSNLFQADVIVGLDEKVQGKLYNTAFRFVPFGHDVDRYRKQILIPLGEYMPFSGWQWFSDLCFAKFGLQSFFSSGGEEKVFEGPVPLGAFICLEETHTELVRKIRQSGASMLVNLTNDVWFPETRLPWHHFDHGRLRAVENGIFLLRATNTGVTSVIDCFGSPVAILPPSETEGSVLEATFPARSYSTFYTRFGQAPILVLCALFVGLLGIRSKKELL